MTKASTSRVLGLAALLILSIPWLAEKSVSAVAVGPGMMPVTVAIGTTGMPPQAIPEDLIDDSLAGRPVIRVGQDYALSEREVVGELRSVFGAVSLAGRVQRDAMVILGPVRVQSTAVLEHSLVVIGGNLTIEAGATVGRDLVVVGGTLIAPPGFAPGGDYAVIGTRELGDAFQAAVPWITRGLLWGRLIVPDLGWVWVVAGMMALLLLGLSLLFDQSVRASADALIERPIGVFFIGLLVLVLTVPAIVILGATIVGLVIVPFVLCALLVTGLVGKAGVACAIGYRVLGPWARESRVGSLAAFLVGAGLLTVAYTVPVLGITTWAFSSVLAVGAASVMLRRRMRRESRVTSARPQDPDDGGDASTGHDQPSSSFAQPVAASRPPATAIDAPPPAPPLPDIGPFPRATFLDRVAAFALDALLVGLAILVLDLSRHDGIFPAFLLVYHVAFWAWKGTTLGGIVVGLRVERTIGGDLRFVDALVRGLVGVFSIAALGIGCFWMLQDPERQMWHDKIAGTLVAKVPREAVLA